MLSPIQKAIDTLSEWVDKINAGFTKTDANEARLDADEGRLDLLEPRVTTNEGDITALDGRVTVNEGNITALDGRVTTNEGDITALQTPGAVQLDVGGGYPYSAGQMSYDPVSKTGLMDTGITDVRVNLGQEAQFLFFNATGGQIDNGTPLAKTGACTDGVPNAVEADADDATHIFSFLGVATHDAPNGTVGLATRFGEVHDVNTSLLSEAPVYLASGGGLTNTLPLFPTNRLLIGGAAVIHASEGVINVSYVPLPRASVSTNYFFSSDGLTSGANQYIAGSYDWDAVDVTLTDASLTKVYGTANTATGAHAAVVIGAHSPPTTGVVGLRVTGTSFTDAGVTTASDSEILSEDITTLVLDEYIETSKNWTGQVTFELYEVSPTTGTFDLTFNYGFSAYVDAGNTQFSITGIRVEGLCGTSDTGFDLSLIKHDPTVWTYAATGFVAGNGVLVSMAADMAPNNVITAGGNFKYKRANLEEYIEGSGMEGFLIAIDTTNNNSVRFATVALLGKSEEIT